MFSIAFQGKYDEAELLLERCEAIEKKTLGPDHPNLARSLYMRAGLLVTQVRAVREFSGKVPVICGWCSAEESVRPQCGAALWMCIPFDPSALRSRTCKLRRTHLMRGV